MAERPKEFLISRSGAILPKVAIAAAFVAIASAGVANYSAFRDKADSEALATLIRTGTLPGKAPKDVARRLELDTTPTGSIATRAQAAKIEPCGPESRR